MELKKKTIQNTLESRDSRLTKIIYMSFLQGFNAQILSNTNLQAIIWKQKLEESTKGVPFYLAKKRP